MDYEVEESDEEAQVMSDGDSDEGGTSSDVDPFASHFNREPYSDKELVQAVADSTKTLKASFPEVDSCLEFQLTDDNAEDASTLFRSNRQVLQRAWKRVNGPIVKSSTKEKKGLLSPFQSCSLSLYCHVQGRVSCSRDKRGMFCLTVLLYLTNDINLHSLL